MKREEENKNYVPMEQKQLEEEYVSSLSELEKTSMKIAEEHLKSSYSLKKSIGFLKWIDKRKEN
tara:strand:+ start:1322 stop:1513 length:192 start_codon:yes stop_codon:yes gene_type:complete